MRTLWILLVAGATVVATGGLAAQTSTVDGVAALARGDYRRAAEILRPLAERDTGADPAAQFFLASMYESGLGVPQDSLRACALYHQASAFDQPPFGTASMRLTKAAFQRRGAEFFADCGLLANLGFDHRFETTIFELDPGHSIAWTLKGATVSYQGRTREYPMRLAGRGAAYLPLRYTPVPQGPSRRIRHFVEVFIWQPGSKGGWGLNWHLFEVSGGELIRIADDDAVTVSPVKPPASATDDVRRMVAMRTNADGHAEWAIIEGPHARSGAIESDEERRETRELASARETALSKVDWSRRYDVSRLPSFSYGLAGGCGDFFVYAWSDDRAEAISLRIDREALQLSPGQTTIDLSKLAAAAGLRVEVFQQPLKDTLFCTDIRVSPGPIVEVWNAVAGRITIDLSPRGISARSPSMYRASIRIEGVEFVDSSGRRHRQTRPIVLSAMVGQFYG